MKKPRKAPPLPKAEIMYAAIGPIGIHTARWWLSSARGDAPDGQGIVKLRVMPIKWVRRPR